MSEPSKYTVIDGLRLGAHHLEAFINFERSRLVRAARENNAVDVYETEKRIAMRQEALKIINNLIEKETTE